MASDAGPKSASEQDWHSLLMARPQLHGPGESQGTVAGTVALPLLPSMGWVSMCRSAAIVPQVDRSRADDDENDAVGGVGQRDLLR